MLVDDIETDRTRKLIFDCERFDLLNKLVHTDVYISHTHYNDHHTTLMLGTDEYIVSVDVMVGTDPDKSPKSFDDYFSSADEDTTVDEQSAYTAVIFHPYVSDPELSEKTGRDYISEMDTCAEDIIEKVTNQTVSN